MGRLSAQAVGTNMEQIVQALPLSPATVSAVFPTVSCNSEKCEVSVHIGIFFDGTGNNRYEHESIRKDSNVARLFRAYPDEPSDNKFRIYIPGVGTRFPEIGEESPAATGMGFGGGGEGRILFAILMMMNRVNRVVSGNLQMMSDETILALCRNGYRAHSLNARTETARYASLPSGDEAALRSVGMEFSGGLLTAWPSGITHRTTFLRSKMAELAEKIKQTDKPKVVEIFIDVFGFSRGAAQARVFCTWLNKLFQGSQLCGVPAQIRFVGLFDTVASVGIPASAISAAAGHLDWATVANLQILARVRNCFHLVAMHENRGSFPLDQVLVRGVLPSNCKEYCCPGMHSDVGGGYAPEEQGRYLSAAGTPSHLIDGEKLSQIPLNVMHDAAVAALVPLNKRLANIVLADETVYDAFRVAQSLGVAFREFNELLPKQPLPLRDRLTEYLAWRYQVRNTYTSLNWTQRIVASKFPQDRSDLVGANRVLNMDVRALEANHRLTASGRRQFNNDTAVADRNLAASVRSLAPEAAELFAKVKAMPLSPPAMAKIFGEPSHDSYAGFRPFDQLTAFGWDFVLGSWESEGYFRFRRRYEGDNSALTLLNPQDNQSEGRQETA